jgi:hypothetical protein
MKNQYIGMVDNELVFQSLDANGLIRGFDTYYPVELIDGSTVLSQSSWTHSVKLESGVELKSGMPAAPVISVPADYADCYTCDTVSCEECGADHNADDCTGHSSDPTWTIVGECTVVCMGCRTADATLVKLDDASDVFKSKNLDGIDLDAFEEIDCLFCDSSGMGQDWERALTKKQCVAAVQGLISEYGELYSGITGIGQFQVYISVYRRKSKKRRAIQECDILNSLN